jgi:hypothetical protein
MATVYNRSCLQWKLSTTETAPKPVLFLHIELSLKRLLADKLAAKIYADKIAEKPKRLWPIRLITAGASVSRCGYHPQIASNNLFGNYWSLRW